MVFGLLTFCLNFIPNIGMACAVLLPMPFVALDNSFSAGQIALAFFGPAFCGVIAKDILEPTIIGHSTSLQPVAVLLTIMCWGSIWGITGMVLAVPITAVCRIYLASIEHPLPRFIAHMLAGTRAEEDVATPKDLL